MEGGNKVIFISITFPILCGIAEAHYYHHRMINKAQGYPSNFKEKSILNLIRAVYYLTLFTATDWQIILASILLFPLLHDGFYYIERDRLHPGLYPSGFFDFGNDAPDGIDLNLWWRVGMALLGIGLLTYHLT